jgi:ABC-type dipeptide/oligopeptide/nickel transport system permease component
VNLRRALGRDPALPGVDIPMIEAITLWAAAIIVVVGILCDLALQAIDPRLREAGPAL